MTDEVPYQPYYCEENAWQICQAGFVEVDRASVVVATNRLGACPHWHHRSAPSDARPVFWDYHVAVVAGGSSGEPTVWDPESRLGPELAFADWWRATYRIQDDCRPANLPEPSFRVVPAETYLEVFSSDRSHMRDGSGAWQAPPPEWAPIYDEARGMNLPRFVDLSEEWVGTVMGAGQLPAHVGGDRDRTKAPDPPNRPER